MARKASSPATVDPALDTIAVRLGDRLRILRLTRKLSQARLGALIGVTAQQVHRYERGSSAITATNLWRIAQALDAPMSFFFDELAGDRPPLL
jgi:transcriptional regulator with XRE-family HTH domain